MLGKNFLSIGSQHAIVFSYGDGFGFPYKGPIKINFLETSVLSVCDADKALHLQRLSGINHHICPISTKPEGETDKESDEEKESDDEEDYEFKNPVHYLDVIPSFACSIPDSQCAAVCDGRQHTIKIINKLELKIEKNFGSRGQAEGRFSTISGIDRFVLAGKLFFVTCETGNQRIQLFDGEGKFHLAMGQAGSLPGHFRQPQCISCFVPKPCTKEEYNDEYIPPWYYGQRSVAEMQAIMAENKQEGDFGVGIRYDNPYILDIVYVVYSTYEDDFVFKTEVINKHVTNASHDEFTIAGGVQRFQCLSDVMNSMQKSHKLKPQRDLRPYVIIAVADTGNRRVQVIHYKWTKSTESCLYLPTLEVAYILGGHKKLVMELYEPVSVSYSYSGELAVCDLSRKLIYLISPKNILISKFSATFVPSLTDNSLNSKTKTVKRMLRVTRSKKKLQVDSTRKLPSDQRACSVSFAPDGKLAVGFRSGGVMIYKKYKSYPVGATMSLLTSAMFDSIVEYLTFPDVQVLRNCCRFFHNHTKHLRSMWQLSSLRHDRYAYMVHNFAKWSSSMYKVDASLSAMARKSKQDKLGNVFDLMSCLGDPTIPMHDLEGDVVCRKNVEMLCNDKYCPFSHHDPHFDLEEMASTNSFLLNSAFLTCVSSVFSPAYVVKREFFVQKLFHAYGEDKPIPIRSDPMTRRNEVVRNLQYRDERVLLLKDYLELMTVLEEDFVEVKAVYGHSLFYRSLAAIKRFTPLLRSDKYGTPCLENSKIYHNVSAQYQKGIEVPFRVSKSKKFEMVRNIKSGMAMETLYEEMKPVERHIAAFELTSNRATTMLDKLFS